FTGRKGWLVGIAGNLALGLAYVGLTRYDPHRAGDLKIANIGVAVTLYVLADVITTNQLGSDSERVVTSLERGDTIPRILKPVCGPVRRGGDGCFVRRCRTACTSCCCRSSTSRNTSCITTARSGHLFPTTSPIRSGTWRSLSCTGWLAWASRRSTRGAGAPSCWPTWPAAVTGQSALQP